MVVLSIIFGVLMVICGISCVFTPVATFLSTGYFFGIMLFVYGLSGIIRAITRRDMHTLGVITSVLAFLAGIVSIVRPGSTLIFDSMVLYLIAAWFVFQGISSIVIAFRNKSIGVSGWYWGLIIGILGVILGIYLVGHPMLTAISAGMLIGFTFIQAGFDLIMMAVHAKKAGF